MKKLLLALTFCMTCCIMAACGDSGEPSKPEEKVYIEESQIDEMFANPSNFKGKYVKLKGKVFTTPEKQGDTTALQIWYDPENAAKNYIVYTASEESFTGEEYVFVDGKIDGELKGENMLGGKVSAPLIKDAEVTKSTYMDVMVPTIKSVKAGQGQEQNDFRFIVDKVEYAEKETRVYLTLTNNSANTISAGIYEAKIVQDGKQISQDQSSSSSYMGDYPQVDYQVLAGASSSGIMVFPPIDPDQNFTFILPDIYSDDYEIQFRDFEKEIKVN